MSNKFKLQQLSEALVIITSYRYDLFKSLKYFCIKQPFKFTRKRLSRDGFF